MLCAGLQVLAHAGYVVKAGDSSGLSAALADAALHRDFERVKEEDDRLSKIYNYKNSADQLASIFEKCIENR